MKTRTRAILVSAEDPIEGWTALGLDDADVVIPAFHAPPETIEDLHRAGARRVLHPLGDPVASAEAQEERRARFSRAAAIVDGLPTYRGLTPLRGWETTIADALQTGYVASRLSERLVSELGSIELHVRGDPELVRALEMQPAVAHGVLRLSVRPVRSRSWVERRARAMLALAREAKVTRDLPRIWYQPLEVADRRFAIRSMTRRRHPRLRGGVWAFSSYVNFSSALAAHAEAKAANWLVNGRGAASRVPPDADRRFLWEFGPPAGRGSHAPTERAAKDLVGAVERPARAIVSHLVDRTLPNVLAEIDCFFGFFEAVTPECVWTANQWGSESAILQVARAEGCPTVQVQHGVLEEYYATAPLRSDRFIVWGAAWREALLAEEREGVEVRDPRPLASVSVRNGTSATFFSQPMTGTAQVNSSVYMREAIRTLSTIAAAGVPVMIRPHPRDSVETWRRAIARWGIPSNLELDVGGSLDEVLGRTRVAVTVSSTVLLECLRHGIPVVSLDFFPVAWRGMLSREGALALGSSSQEAAALALDAVPVEPSAFGRLLVSLSPPGWQA